jgi:cysteine desulfurase/selenocysteine lyase
MAEIADRTLTRANLNYDVHKVRRDFPIFRQPVNGKQLVYLDNAATTQKPQAVIDAVVRFYTQECANVRRGIHHLSELATESYESSRLRASRLINAASIQEIVFVRGATEGINLVAQSYGPTHVGPGDEILISAMEHHSNIVPWQRLCQQRDAQLRVIPINSTGEIALEEYAKLLDARTRLVAVTGVSNVLGTINPVRDIIRLAHQGNIPVLIDGAQAVPHVPVDVRELDCDFYVFSGHKMYGPNGIGVLYAREHLLEAMPPYQVGGEMIASITFEKAHYAELPYKFEAGTPNIAGAIGLGAAIEYLNSLGFDNIFEYERTLVTYAAQCLSALADLRLIGTASNKTGALSFVLSGVHAHDIGTILNGEGVAIRTGHHCAQPLMDFFKVPATARASLGLYNTKEDIEALIQALIKVKEIFA